MILEHLILYYFYAKVLKNCYFFLSFVIFTHEITIMCVAINLFINRKFGMELNLMLGQKSKFNLLNFLLIFYTTL